MITKTTDPKNPIFPLYFRRWESVIAFLNRRLSTYPGSNPEVFTEITAAEPIRNMGGKTYTIQSEGFAPLSFKIEPIPFCDGEKI